MTKEGNETVEIRERLLAEKADREAQLKNLRDNIHAMVGAIQQLDKLLADLEGEAKAPDAKPEVAETETKSE